MLKGAAAEVEVPERQVVRQELAQPERQVVQQVVQPERQVAQPELTQPGAHAAAGGVEMRTTIPKLRRRILAVSEFRRPFFR